MAASSSTPATNGFFEKLRSSMAMRLRGQLQNLTAEFFDEVDDYFFALGEKNSLGEGGVFLEAMREFRAKQRLFEDSLVNGVIEDFKHLDEERVIESHEEQSGRRDKSEGAFAIVEIDLALQAMARRADKHYQSQITRLYELNDKLYATAGIKIVSSEYLASSLVYEFSQSHQVFELSLQSRLIFFKLFEKHCLLNLQAVFQDTINVLGNVIERRRDSKLSTSESSAEEAWQEDDGHTRHFSDYHQHRKSIISKPSQKSEAVQTEVDHLVDSLCSNDKLPAFVVTMIRKSWRAVLFLVGLNRGMASREWEDARETLLNLTNLALKKLPVSADDIEELHQQIRHGFALIRMERGEQDGFLVELEAFLLAEDEAVKSQPPADAPEAEPALPARTQEASISRAGERILDENDLDEIAQLLDDDTAASDSQSVESEVADYMPVIEQLPDGSAIEFRFDGRYETCSLERNRDNPSLFSIRRANSRNPVTRSKLGLAISLQEGELRIPCNDSADLQLQKTVIHKSSARFSRRNLN